MHTTVSSAAKKNKIMSGVGTWIRREIHHGKCDKPDKGGKYLRLSLTDGA